MNKLMLSIAALLVLLTTGAPAYAQMSTTAKQAIVVDTGTGTVLFEKNANEHMPTSSMSKVMTAYMVFEALKNGSLHLKDKFTVSKKAWQTGGSKMFIKVGDRVSVEDLIRGLLIDSGNDAAVCLSEGLGGSEEAFVKAMNLRAKEIGLTNSHFVTASGLPDPDHYSTARDLAVLAYRIMTDFPEYYHYFSEKDFTYNKIHQPNRDLLLGNVSGVDGLKTGHTEVGGYGLMSSAQRDGRRVIIVLNGMGSIQERKDEGMRLMEWAFRSFESKKLLTEGETVDTAKVWLGKKEELPLVAAKDLTVVLPKAQRDDMKLTVKYDSPLKAPVKKGDKVGELDIAIPNQAPLKMDLLAGIDDPRQGIFGRVKSRLGYLITKDF
ncbi:MAG: D-alanyl-D-alanine carboxypeptidase [Alphaproteobacteria bacterium]|nr:D-alanyl-D-alanine carboxypeptidase [Alphaproteobacteria bacterium]